MQRKKICFVASTGIPGFHRTNIEKLSEEFDIYAVMKFRDPKEFDGVNVIEAHPIAIERKPSIMKDLKALWQLYKYFKANKFDAFISQASKPSLLAAIAGRMARIPVRIRIFTGQLWANKKGVGRLFFKTIDRLTVVLNTHILVDGKPQRQYLTQNGIFPKGHATVLANGSICGVDLQRFDPNPSVRRQVRTSQGFADKDIVFSFMGRINPDKGIYELLDAFNELLPKYNNIKLVLFGNSEGITPESMAERKNIRIGENLILYGYASEPNKALQGTDVFCLPSYREGFGMSAIEAAALEMPVICSDAYGLADTFVEDVTGLKCKVKDVPSLRDAMEKYILDPTLITKHGINGRRRVIEKFDKELVSQAWLDYMKARLQ